MNCGILTFSSIDSWKSVGLFRINTKATQAASAQSEERELSAQQERSQRKKAPPASIPEASGDLPEVSSPPPSQVRVLSSRSPGSLSLLYLCGSNLVLLWMMILLYVMSSF